MKRFLKKQLERILPKLLPISLSGTDPLLEFNSWETSRLNQRRLEHLATLNLPLSGRSVLEVGAGIGNLTHFFLDRSCTIVSTEGRPANLQVLAARYPDVETRLLDLDHSHHAFTSPFDIVFCYGLLYHLERPGEALEFMAHLCRELLLLESCVSFGEGESLNPCDEDKAVVSQALAGRGCRPTRAWICRNLRKHFPFVYVPRTQPNHEQFPLDWSAPSQHKAPQSRAVFIASRLKLDNNLLLEKLPVRQERH